MPSAPAPPFTTPPTTPVTVPVGSVDRPLPRTVGFLSATGVMAGIMIGSGIFRTPPEIAKLVGSPWVILLFWAAGGVLSLFGAATYAEMATMFPQSGGVYVFLREGFGRCVAFVFGWTYMLITKPAAAAAITVVLTEHLGRLLGVDLGASVSAGPASVTLGQGVTCGILILLTWLNARGTQLGAGVATVLTALKALALVAIVGLAVVLRKGSAHGFESAPVSASIFAAMAPVMFAIMWTYDGWSDVGAIAGEVRDPQRSLPRIYFAGTAVVTALYLAVNAVYLWVIPLEEMRKVETVAPLVMERLLGASAAAVVTVVIVVSTLGSTHGSIMTGARVSFAQARDGLLFQWLGRVSPTRQTPAVALWTQCALSCLAVLTVKTFEGLADGFVFTMWIFYGLAGFSIFVLRFKRPEALRPYRCWGYPVTPALFVLASAAMLIMSMMDLDHLREKLVWLGILVAGAPVYVVWERLTRRGARAG